MPQALRVHEIYFLQVSVVLQLRAAGGHAVGAGGAAPGEGAELPAAGGQLHPGHGAEAASVSRVLKVGELLY